jgi:Arc/MetJ family transcription regulator
MIYKVYPSGKSQVAPSCYIYAPRFAPERIAVMRTTLALDDELLAEARELTGLKEKSGLIREALKALIERESARRLARLGGSEPDIEAAPRRRTDRA